MDDCCLTCRFWRPDTPPVTPVGGTCHRHAPRPSDELVYVEWPMTDHDDWCGEFQVGRDWSVLHALPLVETPERKGKP